MADMPSVAQPDLPAEVGAAIDALGNRVKAAAIRSLLVEGPATQTELAERLNVNRANLQRHLAVLEELGVLLVQPPRSEPDVRRRAHSVNVDRLRQLHGDLGRGIGLD
jgi:DNA-binding transcriptional ArsR family regulator